MSSYQSPISLTDRDALMVHQKFALKGRNSGATFDSETKTFQLQDEIILKLDHRRYRLDEYHFHVPGEHKIDGEIYPSEIHYVYHEIGSKNVLVIGLGIEDGEEGRLEKLPAILPFSYYEYDGSLTTPDFTPIRWIVGRCSIPLNLKKIQSIAKESRPLQSLDGRIILTGCKCNSS